MGVAILLFVVITVVVPMTVNVAVFYFCDSVYGFDHVVGSAISTAICDSYVLWIG